MESNLNVIEKDEIVNPEQFQVGRAPQEEKEIDEQADEVSYTEQEAPFADGKGTQLADEFDTVDETGPGDEEDEDLDEFDDVDVDETEDLDETDDLDGETEDLDETASEEETEFER